MSAVIITHEAAGMHQVPLSHPERPARYPAVMNAIDKVAASLPRFEAPKAGRDVLSLVHSSQYLDQIFGNITEGEGQPLIQLDTDTWAGAFSLDASLRAVGGACLGVDMVLDGQASTAFSAMRPPGHHAEPDKAMGFCLFSSAAIAAEHARSAWGLERVAVLDFDVHHGNGTQAAFWDKKGLFYASTHQMPLYPGSGEASEQGASENIFNHPLSAGDDGEALLNAWQEHLLPRIAAAEPELIIISAGFDAHKRDPLGGLEVDVASFAELTLRITEMAQHTASAAVVSLLEGGYDLEALTDCTAAHLNSLFYGQSHPHGTPDR